MGVSIGVGFPTHVVNYRIVTSSAPPNKSLITLSTTELGVVWPTGADIACGTAAGVGCTTGSAGGDGGTVCATGGC